MPYQLNRVKFTTADTGTGTSITVAARYSASFFTPAQAGAVDGRRYTYFIQQGNDIEIQENQVYTAGTTSIARGTPALSIVGGTVGTTKITLDTTQVIGFGAGAFDLMFGQTRGADVASAATLVLDTTTGETVNLTGTAGITAVTLADGQKRWALYTGAGLTITVGSNLVGNAGGANVALATGDLVLFKGYASSVVRFTVFPLSGKALVPDRAAGDVAMSFDASPPTGCVELDGSTITGGAATYPLVAARYSWMVSSGNIILPDTRGKFLRGWAHGSSNDPDRASRTARVGDSQTGDYPGTQQADGLKSHAHTMGNFQEQAAGGATGGLNPIVPNGQGTYTAPDTNAAGGNETRPININVMYYMRMG